VGVGGGGPPAGWGGGVVVACGAWLRVGDRPTDPTDSTATGDGTPPGRSHRGDDGEPAKPATLEPGTRDEGGRAFG